MVSTTTGEWERSLAEWGRGRDDGEATGDDRAAAEGWMGVGYCHLGLGRMDEAGAAIAEAEARSAACGFDFMQAIATTLDGMRRFSTGDLDGGIARVVEARRIQERIEDYEGGGVALSFLAQMTFARGDTAGALELYRQAIASFETVGDRPEIARVQCELGWAALASGDPGAARRAFRRAVLANEIGSPRGTGLALFGLAAVEEAEGRSARAVTIAAAAQALSERAGVVVDHPMDPGVSARIAELKRSVPRRPAEASGAAAPALSPAAVLALVVD
jgi:tetratricopeptide (TPR) repeat protein